MNLENEAEFKKKCEEFEINEKLVFNFMYVCAGVYATNMSYRDRPFVFQNDEHSMTPTNFIERIQKGVQIFRECGVAEELIKVGNTMADD